MRWLLRLALPTALAAAPCGPRASPREVPLMPSDDDGGKVAGGPAEARVDRLRNLIVDGDLGAGGLLPRTRRGDVDAAIGETGADGVGVLSRRSVPWTLYDFDGAKYSVRAWRETPPGDGVIEIEIAGPRSRLSTDALLSRLGPPEVELPPRDLAHRAQLVYARLGLTLGVGSFGGTRVPNEPLGRAWIYAPTTTDDYRKRLGGDDTPKPPNPFPR